MFVAAGSSYKNKWTKKNHLGKPNCSFPGEYLNSYEIEYHKIKGRVVFINTVRFI